MIATKATDFKKRHLLLFIILAAVLILSLIALAIWLAYSRGEQHVEPEYFLSVFGPSITISIVFTILLAVGLLYLKRPANRPNDHNGFPQHFKYELQCR